MFDNNVKNYAAYKHLVLEKALAKQGLPITNPVIKYDGITLSIDQLNQSKKELKLAELPEYNKKIDIIYKALDAVQKEYSVNTFVSNDEVKMLENDPEIMQHVREDSKNLESILQSIFDMVAKL